VNERAEADRKIQVRAVASFVLILTIIVVTVLGIVLLVVNKRVAKEEEKRRIVPAVETVEVTAADHAVKILTQGVVESARETKLAAEVGGRVMEISPSFKRGGVVKKGERLVQIDPADYRSALAAAEVRRAEEELALEQEKARVEQAKLDWEKLGSGSKPLTTPISPPSGPDQWLFQGPPAESKFLAAKFEICRGIDIELRKHLNR
jgi:multidrug efflux pump subunit AcrA (membrane-fusion protein)